MRCACPASSLLPAHRVCRRASSAPGSAVALPSAIRVGGTLLGGPLDVIVGAERAMAVSGRHVERLYDFEEHMIGPERRWSTLSTQRRGHRGCRLLLPQLKDR